VLIVRDFSKGLRAAAVAKATIDLASLKPTNQCLALKDNLLKAVNVVVKELT
jgi:hypothetical protein